MKEDQTALRKWVLLYVTRRTVQPGRNSLNGLVAKRRGLVAKRRYCLDAEKRTHNDAGRSLIRSRGLVISMIFNFIAEVPPTIYLKLSLSSAPVL